MGDVVAVEAGDVGVNFLAQSLLYFWVFAENVGSPGERGSRGFVARSEKGHHVVDKLVVSEAAGFEGDGDDVRMHGFFVGQTLFLLLDQTAAGVSGDFGSGVNLAIALEGKVANDDVGYEELQQAENLCSAIGLENGTIDGVEFVGGILQSLEILTKTGDTDNVESGSTGPLADFDDMPGFVRGFEVSFDGLDHFARLGPEDGIEFLDVAKIEGGHKILPLGLVFIAFCKENADAQDLADAGTKQGRFDKVIAFGGQDFGEAFGAGDEDSFAIEQMQIADEAVVGDFVGPSSWRDAGGFGDQGGPLAIEESTTGGTWEMSQRAHKMRVDEDGVNAVDDPVEQKDGESGEDMGAQNRI